MHPSSVLFGRKVEAVVYNEFVFTSRSYARCVSAVRGEWVGEELRRWNGAMEGEGGTG